MGIWRNSGSYFAVSSRSAIEAATQVLHSAKVLARPCCSLALSHVVLGLFLCGLTHNEASAQAKATSESIGSPSEPSKLLPEIEQRTRQNDSLLGISLLGGFRGSLNEAKDEIYEATGLSFGLAFTHVFQAVSDSLPNQDKRGMATTADALASWDLIDRGGPYLGQAVAHVQSRWHYGTTGPEALGFESLGSAIGTADTFDEYEPDKFVLRNLYWRQGSPEAGWGYRVGKITPDGLLASSKYLDSQTTFLPSGGVSALAVAFPDSGLGGIAGWYPTKNLALVGLVSDANADRFNFGDPDEGDLFAGGEFQFRIAPKTPDAGFSKITLWHTDGTKDNSPINAMLGPAGWGYFLKLEQELTSDGRLIGIARFGESYDNSAFYERQAGLHLLLKEPRFVTRLENDLIGGALNWAKATDPSARDEYNAEVFYRFPLVPEVDTTLSYQSVFRPAFTRDIDQASVFSLRIRAAF